MMRALLITAMVVFFAVAPAAAGEPDGTFTKTYDWCAIASPAAVQAGGTARIEVSMHGDPEGAKLACSIIYLGEADAPSSYTIYPPAQDLWNLDGLYVFTVACPQVGDAAEIVPLVFISNDGTWEGRTKHGEGPRFGLEKWCSVSAPHEARRGGWIDLEVSLGLVPAPNLLVVHLVLLHEEGKQVSKLYAAPAAVSESGGEHAFRFELPGAVEASKARPLVFLSPSGRWEDRQLNFDAADVVIDL